MIERRTRIGRENLNPAPGTLSGYEKELPNVNLWQFIEQGKKDKFIRDRKPSRIYLEVLIEQKKISIFFLSHIRVEKMSDKIKPQDYFGFIGPRPTVCVSTIDSNGNTNIAPYSFVTPLSFDPPLIGVAAAESRDTTANCRETENFVVIPVTEDWAEKGVKTEVSLPREESEFEEVGLTEKKSKKISAPGVKEAAINIECEFHKEEKIGDHILLVGKIVFINTDIEGVKNGRLNLEDLGSLGHIKGEEFCISKTVSRIER
ncbi:MAG: flavin reductase family protein [Candidatus Thermoplasmatota archaeon]|nr:flavin reductase family protein [Candidatus Thermoplasmatota archaeon]MBS3789832.1 flavin reductase family protein [Candidatus Thermoplasmatota archaeon]